MTKFNSSDKNVYPASNGTSEMVTLHSTNNWMMDAMRQKGESKVTPNEVTSLSALIAYVAYNSGENEYRVERRLSDRFNIPNVTCLPSGQFDSAIRYLVDAIS